MLIVAPKGTTKLTTLRETFASSIRLSMVSGKVAELELVENAVIRGVLMDLA